MKKPGNYDETQVSNFAQPAIGGHFATVLKVQEDVTQSGKEMIVVAIDFAKEDKQPDFFKKAFDTSTEANRKWPYQGRAYIMVYDWEFPEKTNKAFKAFVTSVEKSNNFKIDWDKDFGEQFAGKKVGVVYGDAEYEYNGEVNTHPIIRWFCEYENVPKQSIPKLKKLPENKRNNQYQNPASKSSPAPAVGADFEIPF